MINRSMTLRMLLLFALTWQTTVWGADNRKQESWGVLYLPISEAEALVKSALSSSGTIAALPSRRLLIVMDDASHLSAAKKLLDQFDRVPDQYRVTLEMIESERLSEQALQATVALPGNWLQLQAGDHNSLYSGHQQWSLLLLAGKEGLFSVGELQPYRQRIKQWLVGYGLIKQDSVNLVALTSGFFVHMRSAGADQVQVSLVPWLARSQPGIPSHAKPELLIGLGTAGRINQAPTAADVPLRLNAAPQLTTPQAVRIARAATQVMVKVGETVEIAASGGESDLLSRTLLGRHGSVGEQSLILRLKVERVP